MPTLVDAGDYERLYAATRGMPREIRLAFRKRLREAARVGQKASRDSIRRMPARGRYSAVGRGGHLRRGRAVGLRSTLALGIRVEVDRQGVAIRQYATGISGRGSRSLPRDIDRGYWRHPVYGHSWKVLQKGQQGYFADEIDAHRQEMTEVVAGVLDDITERISV